MNITESTKQKPRLMMYIGQEQTVFTPDAMAYRCVPFESCMEPNHEFIEIPGDAIYVGSNFTVPDFEEDIKRYLPEAPLVLIIRDNGAGDLILSTPAVAELRRRLPGCHITYATMPGNTPVIDNTDIIDSVISVHDIDFLQNKYVLIINWARAVENYSVWRNRRHRSDSFALHLGLGELPDEAVHFGPGDSARRSAEELLDGAGPRLIGYVMQAAAWNRTWPLWRIPELCAEITKAMPGYEIVLIDRQAEAGFEAENVINLCGRTKTFNEAAAVLAKCEIVIAPDSGLAHACGAVGVPTLVLSAGIPPEFRYSRYPKVKCLSAQGRVPCWPCWDWQEIETEGPHRGQHRSCSRTKRNMCLESIKITEVVENVRKISRDSNLLDVSVCILTRGNTGVLRKCLNALSESAGYSEVIVLASGRTDEVEKVGGDYTDVRFSIMKKNPGVAAGRNMLAQDAGGDFLLFLDDDQYVSRWSIKTILDTAARNNAAIVGTILNETDEYGVGRTCCYGDDKNPVTSFPRAYFGGGGLLVKKDVFQELGGFDTVFTPAFCEDADFCWRAREAGAKMSFCRNAGIAHDGHATLNKEKTPLLEQIFKRSHVLLRLKWPGLLKEIDAETMEAFGVGFKRYETIFESLKNSQCKNRPKILFISDRPDWAIARNVDRIAQLLAGEFEITKSYFADSATVADGRGYFDVRSLDLNAYDLVIVRTILHVPDEVYKKLSLLDPRKVAVTIAAHHCFDDPRYTPVFRKRLNSFAHVFCVSDSIYERAMEYFNGTNHKVYYTPQGIDTEVFQNRRNRQNGDFTIGWAGNVMHGHPVDHKRFFEIILPLIEALHDKYRFVVAARGLEDSIRRHLDSIGVRNAEIPFNEMADYYNAIDLYLNASRSEAIASTTCEAIACGVPVVTTNVGHAPNIIADGINGKIVEPELSKLIPAIKEMSAVDPELISRFNDEVSRNILNWDVLIEHTRNAICNALV